MRQRDTSSARGHGDNFFSFAISHGSFELTAIAISGAAGLLLGWGMVHPGELSRRESLRVHGLDAIKLASGAGFMLAIAALIEAYFSPMAIPHSVKYVVGTGLWMLVFVYLVFGGREEHVPSMAQGHACATGGIAVRVEDCIVTVERRTTGGCIDLAFVFVRRFALPLYTLTACIAGPALACVWFLGQLLRDDILLPSIAIFAVASMLLSGAMIATVGPQVFGVPISTRAAINGLIGRFIPYAFLGILFRMTGLCLFFPLIFVMAWCGHLPEVMFLEHTPLNQITQRLSWLGKGGGYSRNLGRVVTIMFFWIVIAVGLFMIIDLLSRMGV